MPLENYKLVIFLPPVVTFLSCSFRTSVIIVSRKMLKRAGERRHPYLSLTDVLTHSSVLLSCTCSLIVELLSGAN